MLGLVSHTNLMDALVHPRRHISGLNLITSARPVKCHQRGNFELDPVLEDTPDVHDTTVDHSVHPPDVGQSVLLNSAGFEISLCETPTKPCKRVLCSFSCQNFPDSTDFDDYPFHAITYGETDNCFGLSYNDHTYAKADYGDGSPHFSEPEDRLSLLAKLALAKDDKITEIDAYSNSQNEVHLALTSPNTTLPKQGAEFMQRSPVHSTHKPSLMYNSELHTIPSNAQSSLVTTASRLPPSGNRTILFSTVRNTSNPPLQIHRVTSSITPHVVLRTGIPALQITTTAPKQVPTQANDSIRCVCGSNNMDGYLIQCDQCRVWQHSECVSSGNKRNLNTPFLCDRCQSHLPRMRTIAVQQPKITTLNGAGTISNSNIRISRATALSTNNSSGRILVTAPFGGTTRQVHVCLPTTQSLPNVHRTDFNLVSAGSNVKSLDTYASHISTTIYQPCSQPVRSSKRKQDLITLTGGSLSSNVGLEGFSTSPPVSETYSDASDAQKSYPIEMKGSTNHSTNATNVTTSTHGSMAVADNRDLVSRTNASPLQRLIVDYPNNSVHESITVTEDHQHTMSPCSTVSSESLITSPLDVYEEATDLRLSDRLYQKLANLLPSFTGLNPHSNDSAEVLDEKTLASLKNSHRHQVVTFDFNRKGLIATEAIPAHSPILEYHGVCMLLSEYNDVYDYRKHYNPFVLFYKTWSKLALCIDARKYGNEARFIRRSCTPNCEVRHSISFASDRVSGTTPQIHLVIVARRPISQSCELTLPFDFDYTACRYLVKCACVRKACPVTRWFQRMNQLNNSIQSPTRNSLVYSRKLPHSPRPGLNVSIIRNSQADYSEKSPEDIGRQASCNKVAGTINGRSTSTRGLTRNSTDSIADRLMEAKYSPHFVKSNVKTPFSAGEFRKASRRGRGRGRMRGSHTSNLLNRFSTDRISSRLATRGRPGRRRSLTTTRKRKALHRSLFAYQTKTSNPLKSEDSVLSSNLKMENVNGYGVYSPSKNSYRSSDGVCCKVDDGKHDGFKHEQRCIDDHNGDVDDVDDLDADTEPEYDYDQTEVINQPASSHKLYRSKRVSQHTRSDFESSSKHRFGMRNPNNEQMKSDDNASVKNCSNENMEFSGGEMRTKRRSYEDGPGSYKPQSMKKSYKDNSGEKSREEVWMAEVLRRIERMEKKRLKRRIASEKRKPSGKNRLIVSNHDGSNSVSSAQQQVENKQNRSTPCIVEGNDSSPTSDPQDNVILTEVKASDIMVSPADNFIKGTSCTVDKSPVLMGYKPVITDNASSPECKKPTTVCLNSECDDKYISPTMFSQAKKKTRLRRNSKITRNASPQQRRRRSQTAMLSDGLSSGSADQSGSREDRWLQFQLRRIAELEDQTEFPHAQSWDIENALSKKGQNSNLDTTISIDTATSKVPIFEALGLKSCHPDPVLSTIMKIDSADTDSTQNLCHHPSNLSDRLLDTTTSLDQDANANHLEPADKLKSSKQYINDTERNIFDSEADCELIVYRAREKDPMAKFSRGRLVTPNSHGFSAIEDSSTHNTHATGTQNESVKHEPASSGAMRPLSDQLLRPTKKRWLCRALMEDVESSILKTHPSESTVPTSLSYGVTESSPSTNVQTMFNACPVNPKKRIISQLSEYVEDSNTLHTDSDLTTQNVLKHKPTKFDEVCNNTGGKTYFVNHVNDDKESGTDYASNHTLPLPPKKATVKQQAEELRLQEMRKVKVSLSEYRRRRGLPSLNTTSVLGHNNKDGVDRVQQIPDIDNLEINIPQELMSPKQLLSSLPHLKSEAILIKQYELINNKRNIPCGTDVCNEYCTYTPDVCGSEHQPTLLIDEKLNERGPRTPSEPPDDDEDHGVGLNVNFLNHNNKIALIGSPEPYVQFPDKARSVNASPVSTAFNMQVDAEKLACLNGSPLTDTKIPCKQHAKVNSTSLPLPVITQVEVDIQDRPQNSFQIRNIVHSSDGLNFSPSAGSQASSTSYSDLPPPPPPPLPSFPGRSASKSPSGPNCEVDKTQLGDNSVRSHCALQYFIKRDHEIRVWQETRSQEREWKHSSQWQQRNTPIRSFQANKPSSALPKPLLLCGKENDNNCRTDIVSGQFDSVEQTLLRIRDNLQAQLDLTKHKNTSINRSSSTNGSGELP